MQGELERKGAIDPDQEFPVGQLRLSKTVRPHVIACAQALALLGCFTTRFACRETGLCWANKASLSILIRLLLPLAESRYCGADDRLPPAGGQDG